MLQGKAVLTKHNTKANKIQTHVGKVADVVQEEQTREIGNED